MGDARLSTGHSVLIVDRSDESREVLRTVLQRRGMEIFEAGGTQQGLELAGRHRPDVIVLDLEGQDAETDAVFCRFDAESGDGHTSLVVLGEARLRARPRRSGEFISKPYHYGPLVEKILALASEKRPVIGGKIGVRRFAA